MINQIKVGDLVRFVNGDFLIGVATKSSINDYIVVLKPDGSFDTYPENILCKYSNKTLKRRINSILKELREI